MRKSPAFAGLFRQADTARTDWAVSFLLCFRFIFIHEKCADDREDREPFCRLLSAEQFIPGCWLAGERVSDVEDQDQLCIIDRHHAVPVDVGGFALLLCQAVFLSCDRLDVCIQCKLCIFNVNLPVIVDIAGQICRFGRRGFTC